MLKKFLPQTITLLFLVGFIAYAWTGPSGSPPNNNADAPINVGSASQLKAGALGIGGILEVFSNLIKVGTVEIKGDGSVSANLNADKLDDLHAADIPRGALFGSVGVWSGGEFYTASGCSCKFSYPPAYCTVSSFVCTVRCDAGYGLVKTASGQSTAGAWYSFWSCQKN